MNLLQILKDLLKISEPWCIATKLRLKKTHNDNNNKQQQQTQQQQWEK